MKNQAAWLKEVNQSFIVSEAPFPELGPDEVCIETGAVAINPIDYYMQKGAPLGYKYPNICGMDVAGTVSSVGTAVQSFKKGDRVTAPSGIMHFITKQSKFAGFQRYVPVPEHLISKIPDSIPFEEATVLPICMATAAQGLFSETRLNLQRPDRNNPPKPIKQAVLIWGGASSVGACAIQLIHKAGYFVITTCSPSNFEMVKDLGADIALDYNSQNIVEEIKSNLEGYSLAGIYDAVTKSDSITATAALLPKGQMIASAGRVPEGHPAKFVNCVAVGIEERELGTWLYQYIKQGLENGSVKCAPKSVVVEGGLNGIQEAVDLWAKGVSGVKIVVKF